jgi:hypothetical protein
MSKVLGPLLSLSAQGTIAGALTFSNWKGINTVRVKSNPSNPQTLTQMHARALFAGAGKVSKVTDPLETVAVHVKTITPAQQSYASYFSRELLGTGNVNIEAAITQYNNGGFSTIKAYFDDAATQVGLEGVDLDGTANTTVPAGALLVAAYMAAYRLGSPDATGVVTGLSEANVFTFTGALTGTTPS